MHASLNLLIPSTRNPLKLNAEILFSQFLLGILST